MKILIVEDDKNIGNNIKEYLEEKSFIVDLEPDGEKGYALAKARNYDLFILDWMVPNKDGLSIASDLRSMGIKTPIIMLTAKDTVDNKISGLEFADDYIIKPFSLKELLARINVIQRRVYYKDGEIKNVSVDTLSLNLERKEVSRDGKKITLTKKEYQILEFLVRNKDKVVTKTEIQEQIWGLNNDIWSDVVRSHIQIIRAKVDASSDKKLIKTVRGVGFILSENDDENMEE